MANTNAIHFKRSKNDYICNTISYSKLVFHFAKKKTQHRKTTKKIHDKKENYRSLFYIKKKKNSAPFFVVVDVK